MDWVFVLPLLIFSCKENDVNDQFNVEMYRIEMDNRGVGNIGNNPL